MPFSYLTTIGETISEADIGNRSFQEVVLDVHVPLRKAWDI